MYIPWYIPKKWVYTIVLYTNPLFWYIPWYTHFSVSFLGLLHTKLLPFPGGHATQASKFMFSTVSDSGGTQGDMSDWSARDWEDYNYALPAGGAGGGQGAGFSDPLAYLCDDLP
jgi:hypothetical protein